MNSQVRTNYEMQLRKEEKRKARKRKRRIQGLLIVVFCIFSFLLGFVLRGAVSGESIKKSTGQSTAKANSRIDKDGNVNFDGIPESLVELYDLNEEARDFILNYDPSKESEESIDISKDVAESEIPLFLQWDERWGYLHYGDNYMAVNGCGPTALSMVYCGLTGSTDLNPYEMASLATERGYYESGCGTKWSMMSEMATSIGLKATELSASESAIKDALEAGKVIIVLMGPGDFTTTGHFIVITDLLDQNTVKVNDSNSVQRSSKTWNIDDIILQMKAAWSYSYKNKK